MSDGTPAGLFIWGGLALIAAHFYQELGVGIVLLTGGLLMVVYEAAKREENG